MRPQVALTIPQPCHESWAAMTPTAAGRHCAACQKTVVDFTQQTDAEILAYLARAAGGRTCGRFAAGQLERPLQRAAPAAPTARWRAWLVAAAAVWGLREVGSPAARGQALTQQYTKGKPVEIPRHSSITRRFEAEGIAPEVMLRGVVTDSLTGDGLPGVTVLIAGTTTGTSTNNDGTFALPVPATLGLASGVPLQVSSVGYVSQFRTVGAEASGTSQKFQLQQDARQLAGELVVVGGCRPRILPPAPWHPRNFYYWGKYWLTRPFRRG